MKSMWGIWLISALWPQIAFAGAVEEMIETDRAFAQYAADHSVGEAFIKYAAEDVRMFPDRQHPYSGKDALAEQFAEWPEGATLEWAPEEGLASPDGLFGFTWGRYVFMSTGEDGEKSAGHGKYVSIWRKGADGGWKFVVDIGNSNPPPVAAAQTPDRD